MLFGAFLGVYLAMREAAGGTTADWVPSSITFPEITVNVVAITLVGLRGRHPLGALVDRAR